MVKEKICETLRKRIISGGLGPGERLIEPELCEKPGVSRGSIRESSNILMREGFITIIPNKGAIVAKISSEDLKDYYVLLAMLDRKAIEWSIPYITESDIEKLSRINRSLRKVILSNSGHKIKNWCEQHDAFHRFFCARCGNSKLNWLAEEIRQRTSRLYFTALLIESYGNNLRDHEDIIKAVKAKNPKKAGQLMEKHVLNSLKILMKSIPAQIKK